MGDTYGFIKCKKTHEVYNRDVYITKADLPDSSSVNKAVSFLVALNERGRPQAREVRAEELLPETDEEQPEVLTKAHSAPLPSATVKSPPSSSPLRSLELKPLSAPTAPWADIVDDDFDLEEPAPEAVVPEVQAGTALGVEKRRNRWRFRPF